MKKAAPLALLCVLAACSRSSQPNLEPALNSITSESLLNEIRTLSSDAFEGRAPGTPGEEKTIAYLQQQFQQLGLKPGNPNGTYLQNVPLAGVTSKSDAQFTVKGKRLPAENKKDYVALSRRYTPRVDVKNSDIVFVGYGVVAPEYNWDDYKNVDVRGKTILMLVNDPQIPDPKDPSKLDDKLFKGNAMTYYGRWTYKYEIASQKGAAAAIIIHETATAGYPFEVVVGSWGGREAFDVQTPDNNMSRVPVEGWITYNKAAELCKMTGLDLQQLKKSALDRNFKPVSLPGAHASFEIENTLRKIESHNVVAKIEGSDPARKNEYVVYTAHWDHLGRDPSLPGDQIYNGAADNASGTAGLLEIARAYTKVSPAPKRSVLFLSVTAEEKGLLGAAYYVQNPLYPLNKTAAEINMDGLNQWGKTSDLTVVGLGNSELDDILADVLKEHGRTITPDPEPEKGFFYRSDHFEFAKQGVPALDTDSGVNYIGKPPGYGKQKRDEYTEHDYHKPSDEVKPEWDLSGAVEDLRILFEVGYRVAETDRFPQWKPGTEFNAKRDQMMNPNATR